MKNSNLISVKSTLSAFLALTLLVFIFVRADLVSAFSILEFLGLDEKQPEQTKSLQETKKMPVKKPVKKNTEWAKTSEPTANLQVDINYVKKLVTNMKAAERQRFLADPGLFLQAIKNEAMNRSVVSAALANGMASDSNVAFLMQHSAENVLRESYLNRLIVSKLPADFPTEKQLQEYYKINEKKFVIPQSVYMWQIFYKKPDASDKKSISAIRSKANKTYSSLKKGKADFANVAITSSEHEKSRKRAGYVGLMKIQDLLPEIREALLRLKEGEVSKPIESKAGFHIIKRGKINKPKTIGFEKIKDQLRQLLIKDATRQLRKAIFVKAGEEYPQNINDTKIEEWRLRLKTDTVKN